MKDCEGKEVQIGDKILIPIEGEMFHEEKICEAWDVIVAVKRDGVIKPYHEELGYLLEE